VNILSLSCISASSGFPARTAEEAAEQKPSKRDILPSSYLFNPLLLKRLAQSISMLYNFFRIWALAGITGITAYNSLINLFVQVPFVDDLILVMQLLLKAAQEHL
jgi:hypothetical protein